MGPRRAFGYLCTGTANVHTACEWPVSGRKHAPVRRGNLRTEKPASVGVGIVAVERERAVAAACVRVLDLGVAPRLPGGRAKAEHAPVVFAVGHERARMRDRQAMRSHHGRGELNRECELLTVGLCFGLHRSPPSGAAASSSCELVEAPGWVGSFRPGPILHFQKNLAA